MTANGRPEMDAHDVTRAVVIAQVLFTAGNVLTSGGFLYYFVNSLGPSAWMYSLLMITPEMSETASLWTRTVIARLGSRKKTWLIFLLLARFFALGVPAMAFDTLRPDDTEKAFWIIVISLAFSHLSRSIAYVSYLSWISDVVPREIWGRFFALRRIANLVVMISVPVAASLLRADWKTWMDHDAVRWAYVAVFVLGNLLMLLSAIPLWRVPDIPVLWSEQSPRLASALAHVRATRPLRLVVLSSMWLAFSQGLTQTPFFYYSVRVLNIPLSTYFVLSGLMYALQIPLSSFGGWLSERYGDKWPLIIGLLSVSMSMGFWLQATPEEPDWLYGAYAMWGLFGVVNICQRNLLLRVSPPSDNFVPIALYRQVSGLLAGLAGLLGGLALDALLEHSGWNSPIPAYQLIFLLSWIGRATAATWLIPVREPSDHGEAA